MKRVLLLVTAVFMAASLWSQVPSASAEALKERITGNASKFSFTGDPKAEQKPYLAALKRAQHFNSATADPTTGKHKLDSILYELNFGMWIPYAKPVYSYDNAGRVIMVVNHELDFISMQLKYSTRDMISYNPQGKLSEYQTDYWEGFSNKWVPDFLEEYEYNAAGDVSQVFTSYWDDMASAWVFNTKADYEYNTSGLLDKIMFYYWLYPGQWENSSMDEYTWDASSRVTEILYMWWDGNAQKFEPSNKEEYIYHTSGKVGELTSSYFNNTMTQWIHDWKEVYDYDAAANNTLINFSYYDEYNTIWIPSERTEKTFAANNNLIFDLVWSYDELTTTWELSDSTTYSYNNNFAYNDLLLPFYGISEAEVKELFNHMLAQITMYEYDDMSNQWENYGRMNLYWSLHTIGLEEHPVSTLNVYPNPATDIINLDRGDYAGVNVYAEIFDIAGKRVLYQEVGSSNVINVGHLVRGIYILRLSDGAARLYQGKVIIR